MPTSDADTRAPMAPSTTNPYEHNCKNLEGHHWEPEHCPACLWQEGYVAAVKNHDRSGCPGIFIERTDPV
jgi:hypothetical protein